MPRCPVCDSIRVVIIVSAERRAFCPQCGSRWRQEGSQQRNVKRGEYPWLAADASKEAFPASSGS
jgi:Zn-finger nucleic acid-binding protein